MTNPTPHGQVPEALDDSAPEDLAHSANQEALSFGVDFDVFMRLARTVRDRAAQVAALRTPQPAPAGATEEVENLRKALVYVAFALHDTPQYMLAQGIALIDGDTVRVSRDGWTVEASVNPHRQPAPATQQAVGNSGFDHKTAADFLSGKTVSDEALRKFVAASRGAHDDRAALRAQMLALRGVLASREAEIALLKRSLLDAEATQQPCPTCAALARTVMLDQVSFDRKPDCYGIRQITDDEGVEEWEDIRTSPDVAREEANDMMATGRGEIYEVVPLWTTPQPAPATQQAGAEE